MATAKELLSDLLSSGQTKAAIARKLKINSSTLSQIEKGKKPGRNLIEPLQALKSTGKATERERRKTKSGELAKVRRSKQPAKAKLIKTDGRIKYAPPTSLPYVAERRLNEIAEFGGKVSIKVVLKSGIEATLFLRGGEYAARLQHRWAVMKDQDSSKDFFDFIVEVFNETIKNVAGSSRPISRSELASVGYVAIYPDLKP